MTTLQRKQLREKLRFVLDRFERRLLNKRTMLKTRNNVEVQINNLERAITAVNHGHYGFCHECLVPFTVLQMMVKPWGSYHTKCMALKRKATKEDKNAKII